MICGQSQSDYKSEHLGKWRRGGWIRMPDGDPIILGQANESNEITTIRRSGGRGIVTSLEVRNDDYGNAVVGGAFRGVGVDGWSAQGIGVVGRMYATSGGLGIYGEAYGYHRREPPADVNA